MYLIFVVMKTLNSFIHRYIIRCDYLNIEKNLGSIRYTYVPTY